MSLFELLILAISLCFDTFAVSLGGGMGLKNNKFSKKAFIMAFFGFFQASLLFAGWAAGALFAPYIIRWDHWIAFVILAYIGGKMIIENIGVKESKEETPTQVNLENFRTLSILAIATSIDAVAVGVSLAFVDLSLMRVLFVTLFTFIFTALASLVGMESGRKIGARIGKKATILGGVILLLIGVKILIEHLFL